MGEGIRILCSGDFWRAFAHYWSASEVAHRSNLWNVRLCHRIGMPVSEHVREAIRRHDEKESQA
jgi:hypothetical protein